MSDLIEIRIDNEELQSYLDLLTLKTSYLRPLMKNIAGILEDSVEENFEQQGRPKWKELKKSTIEQRTKKNYYPGKILQMRGELAASITSFYDDNSAIVGTNKVYAAIHQFGGKAGRNRKVEVLARPYLKVTDLEKEKIIDTVQHHLF